MWHKPKVKRFKKKLFALLGLALILGSSLMNVVAPKAGFLWTTIGDDGYQGYFLEPLMNKANHNLNLTIVDDTYSKYAAKKGKAYNHKEAKTTNIDAYKFMQDKSLNSGGNLNLGIDGSGSDAKDQIAVYNALANGGYIIGEASGSGSKDKDDKKDKNPAPSTKTVYSYAKETDSTRLLMTFPGNAGSKYTWTGGAKGGSKGPQRDIKNKNITQSDLNHARRISTGLLTDFNSALDLNYTLNVAAGKFDKGSTLSYAQLAKLVQDTANLKFAGGVSVTKKTFTTTSKNHHKGDTMVTIKSGGGSGGVSGINDSFMYQTLKGYIPYGKTTYKVGQYNSPDSIPDTDSVYLNWKDAALEAIASWAFNDFTYDSIDKANASNKFDQMMIGFLGPTVRWIANMLGVASISDLVYNVHNRSSEYWWRGLMPKSAHGVYDTIFWAMQVIGGIMLMIGFANLLRRQAQSLTGWTSARVAWKEELYFIIFSMFILTLERPVLDFATMVNVKITHFMYDIAGGSNVDDFLANNISFTNFSGIIIAIVILVFSIWYTIYYYGRMFFYVYGSLAMPVFYGFDSIFNNGATTQRSSSGLWKALLGMVFVQSFQSLFLTMFYTVFNNS